MFYFTCLNPDDPHDPSVGLINGQLLIPGDVLRREVFDPVVNEVSCSASYQTNIRPMIFQSIDFATSRGPNHPPRPTDPRPPACWRFCKKRIPQTAHTWTVWHPHPHYHTTPRCWDCRVTRCGHFWVRQTAARIQRDCPKVVFDQDYTASWAGRLVEEARVYQKWRCRHSGLWE